MHRGTTTNIADAASRRDLVASYREQFTELRGRDLVGITKPGFGPGPHEAVVAILGRYREFLADPEYERHPLTFNRGGFLRRMR